MAVRFKHETSGNLNKYVAFSLRADKCISKSEFSTRAARFLDKYSPYVEYLGPIGDLPEEWRTVIHLEVPKNMTWEELSRKLETDAQSL